MRKRQGDENARFEIKFVVDAQMGERIRAWARTVLDAGPAERNLRRPGILVKRRTQVALVELERSDDINASVLSSGAWFHRRTETRALSAVCQVSYNRMARALTPAPDRPA